MRCGQVREASYEEAELALFLFGQGTSSFARWRQKGERKDRTSLLQRRPPPLPSRLPLQRPIAPSSTTSTLKHPGESATLLHRACQLQHSSHHRPRRVLHQLWRVLHQLRPTMTSAYSDHYVRLRGRMLDKSHVCASMFHRKQPAALSLFLSLSADSSPHRNKQEP